MRKIILISFLFSFVCSGIAQQDSRFAMYMFNPQFTNPAYCGSKERLELMLVSRNQWGGLGTKNGAPSTNIASLNMPIIKKSMALGVDVFHESIGPKDLAAIMGTYVYRIRVGKGRLAFALRMGLYSYSYNWSSISYRDPQDPYAQKGIETAGTLVSDFGVWYNTRRFFAGLSISNINEPRPDFGVSAFDATIQGGLVQHTSLLLGRAIPIGENFVFKPTLAARTIAFVSPDIDINLNLEYRKKILLGVAGGSTDRGVLMIAYNITDHMHIGYAYEGYTGELINPFGGTHEVFIGYDFNITKSKMLSPRYFR